MRHALLSSVLLAASCAGDISDGSLSGEGDQPGDPGSGSPRPSGVGTSAPGAPSGGGAPGAGAPVPGSPAAPGVPGAPAPTLDLLDKDTGPVGPAPLRRLNRREYNNVVRDLLGDASRPADAWPAESAQSGFDTDVSGQATTPLDIEGFLAAAEQVARTANVTAILGCDPAAAGEDACGSSFIDRFAARAYRRPLAADQKTRLKAVLDHGRRTSGFAAGVRLVIEAVLQSPLFLYRVELGEPAAAGVGRVALTGPELAARLSFFLNGTMPDEPLRQAAESGALRTTAGIEQQARRLLARSDARPILASFHHQWLELERLDNLSKDPKLYPGFGSKLVASLEGGTQALAQHLYVERPDAPLAELLTAPYAFVDANSARTYGLTSTSTRLEKLTVSQPRAGLLTDAAVMTALASATETQPVARGVFVRSRLLCLATPSPPDAADIKAPEPNPQLTTRERFAMHRENPTCAGCHRLIDTIGFGFEHYDAIGRYRTTENGKPIDASGELVGTAGSDGPFRGAVELGRKLVSGGELARCLVESWFSFAQGRRAADADERTVATLAGWVGGPEGKLRELLVAFTRSPAFRFRPPAAVEACR